MSDIPVNAQIAASFGWNVWNDGPGGRWFMDRVHPEKVGTCQVMLVPDYVAHLRNFLVDDLPVQVPARELEYIALENAISRMGWPEIRAFQEELRKGQSIYEDAGGYFMRGFRRFIESILLPYAGDEPYIVQFYECKYWGDTCAHPISDPNPFLQLLIEASRRGAKVLLALTAGSNVCLLQVMRKRDTMRE